VAGRNFKLRGVPSCGINRLSGLKRDRKLETKLDKFFDAVEGRNSRSSVRNAKVDIGIELESVIYNYSASSLPTICTCCSNCSDRPHRRRARMVQLYLPCGAHMYPHLIQTVSLASRLSALTAYHDKPFSQGSRTSPTQRQTHGQTDRQTDRPIAVAIFMHPAHVRWSNSWSSTTTTIAIARATRFITSPPGRLRGIAMRMFVCLSVCPLTYL